MNSPDDNRVPASLTYHLADIYLEELDKVLASTDVESSSGSGEEPPPAPLLSLLVPFFQISARTISNVTYQRIQTSLLDPLFNSLKPPLPASDPPSKKRPRLSNDPAFLNVLANSCLESPKEEGKVDRNQLRKSLLRKLFDVASSTDARESNRRKMYAIWKDGMAEEDDTDRTPEID